VFALHPLEPRHRPCCVQFALCLFLRICPFRKRQVVFSVALPDPLCLPALLQAFSAVQPDGLQHPVAQSPFLPWRSLGYYQRLVHQLRQ
jgi:hypothetical protein